MDLTKNNKYIYSHYLKELIELTLFLPENASKQERLYCVKNGITEIPKCECGKNVSFERFDRGYYISCSKECIAKSSKTIIKRNKTNLERYGNICSLHGKEIEEKTKNTNLEKYGVENPQQNKEIKEKTKKERIKTNINTYGVKNVFEIDAIKEKRKETILKKYGEVGPLNKTKKTNLEKYGVEFPFQRKEIQEKILYESYNRNIERVKDYVIPLFVKEDYAGIYKETPIKYKWKCVKCGNEFEDNFHSRIPRCQICFPGYKSIQEKEIFEFIRNLYNGEIIENKRYIIPPHELDIYLPELNLAIEFNGNYWHSELNGTEKNYHLNKLKECSKKGIKLIHIFEDEWINKKEIVKSLLKNNLYIYDRKINGRDCLVKEINYCSDFFNENHLQGNAGSSLKLGLFYKEELVSCLSFGKPRFSKNYDWEIIRFANKINTKVYGSFGKLFSYFKLHYNPLKIITYSDKRYFDGTIYKKNDFILKNESAPNYFYMKNHFLRESRNKYQKHKLKNLLEDFNPELTEWENMIINGYDRIWDCGNFVFEWIK